MKPATHTPATLDGTEARALRAWESAEQGPPDIWAHLPERADVAAQAREVDERLAGGQYLPLAGITVAVKDNIDVAGWPTTAACPAFSYTPGADASCVAQLRQAGAIFIGKANMDQFATGLVGTRSPLGVVRNAVDARYVAGGSSSGSAVAVALGQVDMALGTDTAGSGRVPAAFNGIVGYKPTKVTVSTAGVVPACPSLDCVSVFTPTVAEARAVALVLHSGGGTNEALLHSAPALKRAVVARPAQLVLGPDRAGAWQSALERLAGTGVEVQEIDIWPFLEAGRMLYGGALVAERYAAVGAFVSTRPEAVDPVVRQIVLDAGRIPAYELARDLERLRELRQEAASVLGETSTALVLPSTRTHPTIDQVQADPVRTNEVLGLFHTFCNPLGLCAAAVPAGQTSEGLPFGITMFAPAFNDYAVLGLAARFCSEPELEADKSHAGTPPPASHEIAVVGAHLRGQPLEHQLLRLGARFVGATTTAPRYRLFALATVPPKPGLVATDEGGAAVETEIWSLDAAGFAAFVSEVPPPLAIGEVELEDGRRVRGFMAQEGALRGAVDISGFGGWRAYLRSLG